MPAVYQYILNKGKRVWVGSVKTVCTSIMSRKEVEFWRDHLCHGWWPDGKPESSMLKHTGSLNGTLEQPGS